MDDKKFRRLLSRVTKGREREEAFSFYDSLKHVCRDYALVLVQQRNEVNSIQACLRDSETQREVLSAELAKLRWVRDEIEARGKRAITRENKRSRMVRR